MMTVVTHTGMKENYKSRADEGKPSYRVGGKMPDGWEFFLPVNDTIWFVRREENSPQGMKVYSVLGLRPAKCPLDRAFDQQILGLKKTYEATHEPPPVDNREAMTSGRIKDPEKARIVIAEERDRTSDLRFFEKWTPSDAYTRNMVGVINLCATPRYYNDYDFRKHGVSYYWLNMCGGGRVPNSKDRKVVEGVWEELWETRAVTVEASDIFEMLHEEGDNFPVVLLHCTHGVNRTGYVACHLMLRHCANISIDEAIFRFGQARGHYVNKEELIDGLFRIDYTNADEGILYSDSWGEPYIGSSS